MIERKLSKLGGKVTRASLFVTRDLSSSIKLERSLEKKSLDLKRKIVEDRGRILKNIGSRDKDSQTGGLLGGALGLLGIGGGGGLLRRGLRRTPRSPSQLLRMQRGTSSLSRVGRLGRLARPLAAVGTGLDFIGRRAEGQSNVQAGVGAAGGLAGSIAGAKTGALLGTAIAGPLGTAVGGVGGAIIGSLAGGRIADLFTGANRRRRFEEERTVARTQKTLFSDALDDFDKVLDKFEDVAPALVLRRGDDDEEQVAGSRRPKPPSPVPFFQRPAVKTTGRVLIAAGLLALLAFQLKKGKIDVKTYNKILQLVKRKPPSFQKLPLEKQLGILKKEARVINKTNRKINPEDGRFFARRSVKNKNKNIQKNIERDQTKQIRKSIVNMKKFMKKSGFVEPSKLERRATELFNSDFQDLLVMKSKGQISQAQFDLAVNRLQLNLKITLDRIGQYSDAIREFSLNPKNFDASGNIISKNLSDMIRKLDIFSGKVLPEINMENMIMKNLGPNIQRKLQEIIQKPKQDLIEPIKKLKFEPPDLSSNNLESPDSTNLALAPRNNIFVINQAPANQINVDEDTNDLTMIDRTDNSFASLNKYAEFTSVAFTT